jgi:hypothetical protein
MYRMLCIQVFDVWGGTRQGKDIHRRQDNMGNAFVPTMYRGAYQVALYYTVMENIFFSRRRNQIKEMLIRKKILSPFAVTVDSLVPLSKTNACNIEIKRGKYRQNVNLHAYACYFGNKKVSNETIGGLDIFRYRLEFGEGFGSIHTLASIGMGDQETEMEIYADKSTIADVRFLQYSAEEFTGCNKITYWEIVPTFGDGKKIKIPNGRIEYMMVNDGIRLTHRDDVVELRAKSDGPIKYFAPCAFSVKYLD